MADPLDVGTFVSTIVFCIGAGALIIAHLHRRHDRHLALLLDRLSEVEKRISGAEPSQDVGEVAPVSAGERAPIEPSGISRPPSDPLAGKTTHVKRVITGAREAESLADEVIVYISQRLAVTVTPAQIADDLGMSLRTLERGLSVSLSCTPGRLILAMKMREARRLLRTGQYRVNEVARKLDFSSSQHFARRFKSFYGVPPRRQIKDHPMGSPTGE